jgi:protein-tyrosine phosphatase
MTPDLHWLQGPWRGRLALASRPRGGDWLDEELTGWQRAGVNVVVSLLEEQEAEQLELLRESEIAKAKNLEFVSFPIPDRDVPSSRAPALAMLRRIVEILETGRNVVVHCRQGVGRAGMIATGALVISGIGVDKAIETVSAARGLTVPETPDQLQWIRRLPSEHLVAK